MVNLFGKADGLAIRQHVNTAKAKGSNCLRKKVSSYCLNPYMNKNCIKSHLQNIFITSLANLANKRRCPYVGSPSATLALLCTRVLVSCSLGMRDRLILYRQAASRAGAHVCVNPETVKINNLYFLPLEVVFRYCAPQLQAGENC